MPGILGRQRKRSKLSLDNQREDAYSLCVVLGSKNNLTELNPVNDQSDPAPLLLGEHMIKIDYNKLQKVREEKYYKASDIGRIFGRSSAWASYLAKRHGVPFTETEKMTGTGEHRRLYKGKDIINVLLAKATITDILNEPKPENVQKPCVWDTPTNSFHLVKQGNRMMIQRQGSPIKHAVSKLAATWAAIRYIWR